MKVLSAINLPEMNERRQLWSLLSCSKVKMLRTLGSSSFCNGYNNDTENLTHALRDCSSSRDTWLGIKPDLTSVHFFDLDFLQWVQVNITSNALYDSLLWGVISIHTLWML